MTEQNRDQRSPQELHMKEYHEGIAEAHGALADAVEGRKPESTTTNDGPALKRLKEYQDSIKSVPGRPGEHQGSIRERSLTERIEWAYDRAIEQRRLLEYAQWVMDGLEWSFKHEYREEWAGARDADTRSFMLASWLADDKEYQQARDDRDSAQLEYELAIYETKRLRQLVEARWVEGI